MAYVSSPFHSSRHSASTASIASSSSSSASTGLSPSPSAFTASVDWQWLDSINYQDDPRSRSLQQQQQQQQQHMQQMQQPYHLYQQQQQQQPASSPSAPVPLMPLTSASAAFSLSAVAAHTAQQQQQQQKHYAASAYPALQLSSASSSFSSASSSSSSAGLNAAGQSELQRDRQIYSSVIQSIQSANARQFASQPSPASFQQTAQQHSAAASAASGLPAMGLPPPLLSSLSSPSSSSPLSPPSSRKLQRRRKLACSTCRHVKSECSGDRPCRRCIRLNKADTCSDPTTPYPPKKPRSNSTSSSGSGSKVRKDCRPTGAGGAAALATAEIAKVAAAMMEGRATAPVKEEGADVREREREAAGLTGAHMLGLEGEESAEDLEDGGALLLGGDSSPPSSPSPTELCEEDFTYTWLSADMYRQVVPVLATMFTRQPAVVTTKSSTGLLYRLGHMAETMPPSVFRSFLDKAGYVPQHRRGQDEAKMPDGSNNGLSGAAAADGVAMEVGDGGAGGREMSSTSSVSSPGSSSSPSSPGTPTISSVPIASRTNYRSPHAHLPSISLPHRFRFNWSLSPETAFPEEGLVTNFPTIMWYHYPPAAHWVYSDNGLIVPVPAESFVSVGWSPSSPLHGVGAGERTLLPHEIDLSLTEQHCILLCNTAAERLFGYSMRELKLAFIREGKKAFMRLFDGSIQQAHDADMRKYNSQGQTDFFHWVGIRTKFGSVLRVLMNRKFVVDEDGFVIVNRYTFISPPKDALDEDRQHSAHQHSQHQHQ